MRALSPVEQVVIRRIYGTRPTTRKYDGETIVDVAAVEADLPTIVAEALHLQYGAQGVPVTGPCTVPVPPPPTGTGTGTGTGAGAGTTGTAPPGPWRPLKSVPICSNLACALS